jgi:hypothetical protein
MLLPLVDPTLMTAGSLSFIGNFDENKSGDKEKKLLEKNESCV